MTLPSECEQPDLVLVDGKIITVDPTFRIAQAVAIKGDRILAVGSTAEIDALVGPLTRRIDLRGRCAIPGLIDGHAHMDREGLKDVYPSLAGCRSIPEVLAKLQELVKQKKPGEWVVTMPLGDPPSYWDVPNNLVERRFPTRWELDQVSPDNPVYIRPIWGFWRHVLPLVSVANTRALQLAGLSKNSAPPCPGITYGRDSTGELDGTFIEDAYIPTVELAVFHMMPRFSHEDRVRGLPYAMRVYNSFGTTSIYEEHGAAQELIQAYQVVRAQNRMTVRTHLVYSPSWVGLSDDSFIPILRSWSGWLGHGGLGDDWLRVEGMYTSFGVSPQNRARARAAPYTGWSGFNYSNGLPRARMAEFLAEAARNNIRIACILMDLLEFYKRTDEIVPLADKRWVIGHINTISNQEVALIKELGVVLTTHTNRYIYREGHLTRDRVGKSRENEIVPLRKLLDAGIRVAFGSDNSPPSLFYPIWQAVTRSSRYVDDPIVLSQAISRAEAIQCATINGAYLTFSEHEKGSIEAGKLADVAVLSDDPLTCSDDALKDIASDMTIVGGRIVYERDATCS